jgi:TRAP-type C4-dicarboxylate transport system substrate-binding protein
VTYGVHRFHKFHTVTNHFYISRPVFLHRKTFESWPSDLQTAMQKAVLRAVAMQRDLAVEEDREARQAILAQGCEITEVTADGHAAFAAAVTPLIDNARRRYGEGMFAMVPAEEPHGKT